MLLLFAFSEKIYWIIQNTISRNYQFKVAVWIIFFPIVLPSPFLKKSVHRHRKTTYIVVKLIIFSLLAHRIWNKKIILFQKRYFSLILFGIIDGTESTIFRAFKFVHLLPTVYLRNPFSAEFLRSKYVNENKVRKS